MKLGTRCSTILLLSLILSACGGGGGGTATAPPSHQIDISWAANREAAVNSPGGGYIVAVSGQPTITVPYVSGVAAPTTISTMLKSGSYSVTVTAYSALIPPAGGTGSTSQPSATYSFSVP
jgi:hypothetical protein